MLFKSLYFKSLVLLVSFCFLPLSTLAATLSMSPATGVYTAGSTFVARVVVNTSGQSINAAEGTIKFNPQELTVVSVDRSGSIFNLWVTEPTFSNSAGTITFSGGMPSGYKGASGSIFNVTFRTTNANTARVSLTTGAVLANDGMGTNVLSSMNGGTYTIQAPSTAPTPEIIEYVAPANTPAAPKIVSTSHADSEAWYQAKNAKLTWDLPSGVSSVRTLLDTNPNSIPTKVYESPISNLDLEDLPEGVSYFHLQFKNSDGWGKVTHYRLGVDTEKPEAFDVSLPDKADLASPIQVLSLNPQDKTSGINKYSIRIDADKPYEYLDVDNTKSLTLPSLLPGEHTIIIEAFDKAGNSIIAPFSFTILAFDKPVFTEYPSEINEDVIPVIRGTTRPNVEVEVTIEKAGVSPTIYNLLADSTGVFTLIPDGTFSSGVYKLTARAKDKFGAQSELSEAIKIAVQQPGYVQVGTFLINILSVVVPLFAMLVVLVISIWFLVIYLKRFRRKVSIESKEVVVMLDKEFKTIHQNLQMQKLQLINAHKTKKLTQVEEEMFASLIEALRTAQLRVEKEVTDVEKLVQKNK